MSKNSYVDLDLTQPAALNASAGTGKTYSLIRLALLYLLKKDNPPTIQQILLVTFTNKATAELRHRLRELLKGLLHPSDETELKQFCEEHRAFLEREDYHIENDRPEIRECLERAYANLDEAPIYTIHSFCQYLLRAYPFESRQNFHFALVNNQAILEQLLYDFFRQQEQAINPRIHLAYRCYTRSYKFFKNDLEKLLLEKSERYEDSPLIQALKEELRTNLIHPDPDERNRVWEIYQAYQQGNHELNAIVEALRATAIPPTEEDNKVLWQELKRIDPRDLYALMDILAQIPPKSKGDFTTLIDQLAKLNLYHLENGKKSKIPFFNAMKATLLAEIVDFIQKKHPQQRQEQAQLRFNDLIDDVYQLLAHEQANESFVSAIRRNFRVALIDEFQDTDHKQWAIFKRLFSPSPNPNDPTDHTYLLIGDPKQSIYRFRGANLQTYLTAMQSVPQDNICTLANNYRSNAQVIKAINQLFAPLFCEQDYASVNAENKEALMLMKNDKPCTAGITLLTPTLAAEAKPIGSKESIRATAQELLVQQIHTLLDPANGYELYNPKTQKSRKLEPSDIACLTETHKEGSDLKEALYRLNIHAVNISNQSLFASQEFLFLQLFLQALIALHAKGTAVNEFFYHHFLHTFRQKHPQDGYARLVGKLETAKALLQKHSILRAFDQILTKCDIMRSQLAQPYDGERFFINIRHLEDLLIDIGRSTALTNPTAILHALQAMIDKAEAQDESNNEKTLRLEHDENALQILTAHKAKGLEFPIVFSLVGITNLNEIKSKPSLAYMDEQGKQGYRYGIDATFVQMHTQQELDEKKRLFYVACTRAQSHLYLPYLFVKDPVPFVQFLQQFLDLKEPELEVNAKGIKVTGAAVKQATQRHEAIEDALKGLPAAFAYLDIDTEIMLAPLSQEKATRSNPQFIPASLDIQIKDRMRATHSYTSLTKNLKRTASASEPEDDQSDAETLLWEDNETPAVVTALTLKGGKSLGLLLHQLFEEKDFSIASIDKETFLTNETIHHQFHTIAQQHFHTKWIERNLAIVKEIFWQSLNVPMPHSRQPLHQLDRLRQSKELSFRLFLREKVTFNLNEINYTLKQGLLTGFIDLFFEDAGKFYIIDWKSSNLGESLAHYTQERMQAEMHQQHFTLQYHIYLLAITYYVQMSQRTFSYDQIGGVYYLFCRGIQADQGHQHGVLLLKPTQAEFEAFQHAFSRAIQLQPVPEGG
ncbi:UvrD-helicase domain-containing protein [Entomospira culicis]|uniref:RecBCD enzyme subunit RecB n=1 Tax=Entomospira culicis TaxID=2719989 RepID=A0A968GHP7_9SPIO|nr:UvrD-helicase domain-containing protein [Entomospira culicis]NIZ19822.1 UvrD-helicase domain-containing protein [Entomospira culicis]NIZ70036.1 UvrD-helicase domain-containing protein [Entomospira culicis]WDI37142.1 UvrD-helicase domain-containing protein [Entomospira culicis]WDI38771.1 UvrD-helicase domain-containing protein [Entomospira culicis]